MAYSLTLYIYPSPCGVDWRSPYHLTWSVVKNALTFRPRTIGHVSVHLQGPGVDDMAGMAAVNFNDNRKLILIDRLGLGSLFHWVPGKVEDRERLEPEIQERLQSGKFSFIRFEISQENFSRALQFLREYREKNIGKKYGLPFRPRHGEGGGCSAFAASFLEVAGAMQDEFRANWSSSVRVPEEYVGAVGSDSGVRKVSIFNLLVPSKKNRRWAEPQEDGRDIFFWDPDMMHHWVLKKWKELQQKPSSELKALQIENTKGIFVDASKNPPVSEPIWLS